MEPTELVCAKELATIIGQSEKSARRLLADLEKKHGAKAVTRVGRERCTTWGALERYTVFKRDGGEELSFDVGKLMSTLRRVLSQIAEFATRLGEYESDVSDLRVRVAQLAQKTCLVEM